VRIRLNGEPHEIEPGLTVAGLLETLDLGPGRVAVAVNGEVVPGSRHDAHRLADDDDVEVIHAVAGG
jgi:sulfur carrier protein